MCNIFVWITTIVLIAVLTYALYMRNVKVKSNAAQLEKINQEREETEKWVRGADLAAKDYSSDPELKEWMDFVEDIPETYTRSEIYAYDEFAANIEAVMEKLSSGELEKIGIGYNDTLFAVVLPIRKKGEDHERF
ncbi:hypothetical protein [Sulfuricurvum sp.]|uniref:hypothetical protein n=1 Tax=Sulfuricurvum sp. TaxID=2025608 RepID=UPI0026220DA1|nr:hypothetical protein [Sulfuricurvum sp.]MDD2781449.1 hypothetical protein [Sulfuricurvum sp.]